MSKWRARANSPEARAPDDERPFSGEYPPDSLKARDAVAAVLRLIADAEARERALKLADPATTTKPRRRQKRAQAKFELAAAAIVSELAASLAKGNIGRCFVPRRMDVLERQGRYRSEAINTLLPAALDQLEALSFISQVIGYIASSGDRHRTVIAPGPALDELVKQHGLGAHDFRRERAGDEIVLKVPGHEEPIEYNDDGDTRRMRAEMQVINGFNRGMNITALTRGANDPLNDLDLTKRKLRRIFSRGTFSEGGRLYGGFWQDLKSEQRRETLLIDGQPLVEVDLSSAGLRILYGIAKAQPPDGDLYAVPGLPAARRDDLKRLTAALTFIDSGDLIKLAPLARRIRPDLVAGGDGDDFERYMADKRAVEAVVDAIKRHHAPIAHYLPSLIGHRVQRVESDVLVSALLDLVGKGVPALPVHDALLVRHDHAGLAMAVMADHFKSIAGVPALAKVK